ncbi:MAG: PLP-dependent aminotransferase family protein, partial [Firmicutes bacterium]|nr:PLP-dependent aminotransferase family protein [Bacillota bacterium]
ELLEDEGYISPRERSGYFVVYNEKDVFGSAAPVYRENYIFRSETKDEAPALKAPRPHESARTKPDSAGRENFPVSVYSRAVRKVLSDRPEDIMVKSPGKGCMELRTAISVYLARSRGIKASPEQIVIGSGAEYLYGLIVDMLGRYRNYGIEDPSYGKILQVYTLNGAHTEMLPLRKDGISSAALRASSAGVLHITPYRSYPSGISASASKKREYLAFAKSRGAWIIEDDFESEYTPSTKPEETLFQIDGGVRVIYVNSFSMTVSPGERVAYMVLPELLLKVYDERLGFCSCSVPTLNQLVLAEIISGGDFERHINRVRRKIRREGEIT